MMKTSASLSPAANLNVVGVQRGDQVWTVTVDSRQPARCPGCGAQFKSRHGIYSRTLRDLSAQGATVVIDAHLARWRRRNDRRIFTERLPGLAAPFARQAARLAEIVRLVGHSMGGRPSERLMRRLGMPVGDTTILRGLKGHAGVSSANGAARVAGIDDWAWRKGLQLRHDHRGPGASAGCGLAGGSFGGNDCGLAEETSGSASGQPRPCWSLCGGRASRRATGAAGRRPLSSGAELPRVR